jgi:death on curing protein
VTKRRRAKKEPTWIEERDVLAIHERLIAMHGGATGLRDPGLLQSALARPRQHHADADRADVGAMAALYTAGIVRNRPFVDGNKRTGFVVGILFLELNGFDFNTSEEDAAQAVWDLAADELDETAFAAWLGANVPHKRGR